MSRGWWHEAPFPAASICGTIALWWLLSATGLVNPLLLPSPVVVAQSALHLLATGVLVEDTVVSLVRVLEGFVIAVCTALPIGALMGMFPAVRKLLDPLVELVRPIPPIAFIPLAILWFGIGEASKVFIIAFGAFFPILLNTMAGFRSVEPVHIQAASSLGANRRQIFVNVVLWSAVPDIVTGMRVGMGLAFVVLVAAELIASSAGLGFLIQDSRLHFLTERVIVGMLCIGVLGLFLNKLLLEIERRVVRWQPRAEH